MMPTSTDLKQLARQNTLRSWHPPWRSTPKTAASKIRSRANRNLAGGFLRSLNPPFTCDYWASKRPTSFGSFLCARSGRSRGLKPEGGAEDDPERGLR